MLNNAATLAAEDRSIAEKTLIEALALAALTARTGSPAGCAFSPFGLWSKIARKG
ncbi:MULTISPECIES: hypothetical protein [unclassified Rhizobium]|uniref:hypothetical protein n=1 Tax=unclassified Rhizobium TaxID=2613769 RepID=UPI001600FB0D|nr:MULTISPECIES: hypothetical protein [unclassified Rhizobium]MBB1250600.1 hypothetical protein [Rhizobium sp. G21]MCV3764668.1 hypothetical protein [Rhizobium sp. TRM95796]